MTIREFLSQNVVRDEDLQTAEVFLQRNKPTDASTLQIYLFCAYSRQVETCRAQAAATKVLLATLTPEQLDSNVNLLHFVEFMTAYGLFQELLAKAREK